MEETLESTACGGDDGPSVLPLGVIEPGQPRHQRVLRGQPDCVGRREVEPARTTPVEPAGDALVGVFRVVHPATPRRPSRFERLSLSRPAARPTDVVSGVRPTKSPL